LGWEEARVGRMIDRYVRKNDIMREREACEEHVANRKR
jgi:hypothetical protein